MSTPHSRLEFEDASPDDIHRLMALEATHRRSRRAPVVKLRGWLESTIVRVAVCYRRTFHVDAPSTRSTVGYIVYGESLGKTVIVRVAVHNWRRKERIGTALLDYVDQSNRPLLLSVPEDRLDVQLWLRACGFRCERIHKSSGEGLDSYEFCRQPTAVVGGR